MPDIKIEIAASAVLAAFNRLQQTAAAPGPVLAKVGDILAEKIRMGFHRSQDPYGNAWHGLAVRQGKPLVDKGHLRNSITYRVVGNSVEIGTNRPFAAVHQFGATIRPKPGGVLRFYVAGRPVFVKKGVSIPARPFLPSAKHGLPASWEQEVLAVIERAIARQTQG